MSDLWSLGLELHRHAVTIISSLLNAYEEAIILNEYPPRRNASKIEEAAQNFTDSLYAMECAAKLFDKPRAGRGAPLMMFSALAGGVVRVGQFAAESAHHVASDIGQWMVHEMIEASLKPPICSPEDAKDIERLIQESETEIAAATCLPSEDKLTTAADIYLKRFNRLWWRVSREDDDDDGEKTRIKLEDLHVLASQELARLWRHEFFAENREDSGQGSGQEKNSLPQNDAVLRLALHAEAGRANGKSYREFAEELAENAGIKRTSLERQARRWRRKLKDK